MIGSIMDLKSFDKIFGSEPDVAISRSTIEQITTNRGLFDGELFIDKLLKLLRLDEVLDEPYPPQSNKSLRAFYKQIVESDIAAHYKTAVVYYLLKDIKHKKRDPVAFADRMFTPKTYQIFMDGIWSLDRMKLEEATESLTDPSLTHPFAEDILYALLKHSKTPSLPLVFYHAVQPTVTTPNVIDALFDRMCEASITEAFFYARGWDDTKRRHLFERMLLFVHNAPAGQARGERAVEVIPLPFDVNEEQWFEDYLLRGKGKSLHGATDSVIMRKIATGRQAEAAKLTAQSKNRKVDGVNWTSLTQNVK